jgi:hypothetical protein
VLTKVTRRRTVTAEPRPSQSTVAAARGRVTAVALAGPHRFFPCDGISIRLFTTLLSSADSRVVKLETRMLPSSSSGHFIVCTFFSGLHFVLRVLCCRGVEFPRAPRDSKLKMFDFRYVLP